MSSSGTDQSPMESVNSGTFQQYVRCLNGTFHEIKHPQVRIAGQNSCLRHRTAPTIGAGRSTAPPNRTSRPTAPRLELAASKRNSCLSCARDIYDEFVKQEAEDALAAARAAAAASEAADAAVAAAMEAAEEAASAAREAAVAAAAAVREAADAAAAAREAVDTAAAAARDAPASTTAASMTAGLVAGCHDARVAALATAAGEAAPVAVAAMADWVATEAEIIPAVHRAATTAARIATMDLRATDAVAVSRGDAVKAAAPYVAIASVRAAMAGGASLADAGAQAAAAMAATTVLACNPPNTLAAYNSGDNSLHYVARSGNLRLLCQLIALIAEGAHGHDKVKALVRKPNARGETVLHETIVSGNKGMVELLMWVDPELAEFPAAAGNGDSPLYLAISLGDEDIVRILTTQSKNQIPCFGPAEQNGLHAAVFRGKDMTKAVLDSSERNLSEETDNNDSSPLHFVVSVAVQYFRMWGLRIGGKRWVSQLPTQDVLLNEKSAAHKMDKQGLYPVHVAAKMNRVDAIDIMLKTCPDSVFLRDDNGRTFLHTAVEQESLSVVRYACATSAAASVLNARDKAGDTALHRAVWVGDLSVFYTLMLKKEVSLNLRNDKNQTPIDVARCMIRGVLTHSRNPDILIHSTLENAGGTYSGTHQHHFVNASIAKHKPVGRQTLGIQRREEFEDKKSAKLTDSARALGICSVLIASVTFSVTFAVLAGLKSADGNKDGTTAIFGTWYFNAFMMANTLAFIYSLTATVSVMYSGQSVIKTVVRLGHVGVSTYLVKLSLTCLTAAFALGLYTVRGPLDHTTTAVFSSFLVIAAAPMTRGMDYKNTVIVARILMARRGIPVACGLLLFYSIQIAFLDFWPMIPIAGWAVCSRYLVK